MKTTLPLALKLGDIILYKGFWGIKKLAIYNGTIGDYAFIDDYNWQGDSHYIARYCKRIPQSRIIAIGGLDK